MADLTKEQLDNAGKILLTDWDDISSKGFKDAAIDRIRRATPFLQLPWGDPTEEEFMSIAEQLPNSFYGEKIFRFMCEFVRRRNDDLLPKPMLRTFVQDLILRARGCTFTQEEYEAIEQNIRTATHFTPENRYIFNSRGRSDG